MKYKIIRIWIVFIIIIIIITSCSVSNKIDRVALVGRNSPSVNTFDKLSSFSVGNGNFAFTVDATGLQTFEEHYSTGVPLGTYSQWGWHSFKNDSELKHEEVLKSFNFRGWDETYAVGMERVNNAKTESEFRKQEAINWYRSNPHRVHLGYVGLELFKSEHTPASMADLTNIDQTLNLWTGVIESSFDMFSESAFIQTTCHPQKDMIAVKIKSELLKKGNMKVRFKFPYPTGKFADNASDWDNVDKHETLIENVENNTAIIKRIIDSSIYYVIIHWDGKAKISIKDKHYFVLTSDESVLSFTCEFLSKKETKSTKVSFDETYKKSKKHWFDFWNNGGVVDFSECTDKRAKELERRVVLSQYLTAIQTSGIYPPAETGLTSNSWFGKFHLEMHWWHGVHYALWNRIELLERSMDWYFDIYPIAKEIAGRQGFEGIRWMKMTDPTGLETPSDIGSFLIWQQPNIIYFAELIYRQNPTTETINKYYKLVNETAEFMASYVTYDEVNDRYVLKGFIPVQEMFKPSETLNTPFELSYWHYGLSVAQIWKTRAGKTRNSEWDSILEKLSMLKETNGVYMPAENIDDYMGNIRYRSDHPAALGAYGMLPKNRLFTVPNMKKTLEWIWSNWNWDVTWGWDFPLIAMNAARLGNREIAVSALLKDVKSNTYLNNGHNGMELYKTYLPANGGLLTTIGMMCAGWDGNTEKNPGFPKNGEWNVRWEGLSPMP